MSSPVTLNIPHELGRAEARKRIDEGFGKLAGQLGSGIADLKQQWDGDRLNFSLRAMGQAITGAVDVGDQAVRLEVLLPGLLGMIAGKIKGKLQSEGKVLLEHRKK